MQPQHIQKVILNRQQVQQPAVQVPREDAGNRARHGVEDKVVRRRHDGRQDDERVEHAGGDDGEAAPAQVSALAKRDCRDGEADEERVAKVQGWHGGCSKSHVSFLPLGDYVIRRRGYKGGKYAKAEISEIKRRMELTVLVAEPVRRPHTAVAVLAVDRVDEPVALGLLGVLSRVVGRAEQPRGHAGPKGKDDEGEEVAHGHGAASLLVDIRAKGSDQGAPVPQGRRAGLRLLKESALRARRRHVEEDDEVEDGAGDVDERVGTVGPSHQLGVAEEPLLDRGLDEDAEPLLDVDHLEGVLAGRVDRRGLEGDGGEGTSELVDLSRSWHGTIRVSEEWKAHTQ